jgi:hypothetical protein
MMLKVRRIVTGHDEFGMGNVVSDEKGWSVCQDNDPHWIC